MSVKFTKRAYDRYAEKYHQKRLTNKLNFWNRFMIRPFESLLKGEIKNKIVLDLGCGSGITTTDIFKLKPKKVSGLDLSPRLIEIAKKENPKIDFYAADAKKTPFKKSQFDTVASSLVAHYFKDLRPLFREVSRILKKNGAFVFSIHHPTNEIIEKTRDKKHIKLMPYFDNRKYSWKMGGDEEKMISYHHTLENISTTLADSEFIIEKMLEPTDKKTKVPKLKKKLQYPTFLLIKARKIK